MTQQKRKLARHVTVGGVTYGPNDHLPDEVAAQIRTPKAWIPVDETAPADTRSEHAGTTSGARLAKTVTVGGRNYSPSDEIPDAIAKQIRNPKAWEGGRLPTLASAEPDKGTPPGPADADKGPGPETAGNQAPKDPEAAVDKAPATGTKTEGDSTDKETGTAAPADKAGKDKATGDESPRTTSTSKKG